MTMFSTKPLLLALLAGSFSLTALAAGPSNDNFAAAAVLTVDGNNSFSATADNTTATAQAGEPDHFTYGGSAGATHSLWWKFVALYNGTVQIDTKTSAIRTALAVYTGAAVNHLVRVAQDAGFVGLGNPAPGTGLITFPAVKGTTYQIAVDGFARTDVGALSLKLQYLRINMPRTYQTALYGDQHKENNGLLTVTTSTSSLVTGSLALGAHSYPFTGAVATSGRLIVSVNRPGQSPVLMDLTVGQVLNGAVTGIVTGNVEVDDVSTPITAWPALTYTAAKPCPRYQLNRHYNVAILPTGPVGFGVSMVTVSATGICTGTGILADGVAFTYSAPILDNSIATDGNLDDHTSAGIGGTFCYHVPLYGSLGQITGRSIFYAWPSDPTELLGELQWFRPAPAPGVAYLPEGINGNTTDTNGNIYMPPDATHRVDPSFDASNGLGGLDISSVDYAALKMNTPLSNANLFPPATAPNYVALKVSTATGLLTGTVKLLPASVNGPSKVANVYGIIVNAAGPAFFGFVPGTTGTSTLVLSPGSTP